MVYEHYNHPLRQLHYVYDLTPQNNFTRRILPTSDSSFHMIVLMLMVVSWLGVVSSGAVGECRSECVEQNLYKIVRVHLKEDFVMVGICRNTSVSSGALSTVIPFICNRHHGIWTLDTHDEEGIVHFKVRCPPNNPVRPVQLSACPRSF